VQIGEANQQHGFEMVPASLKVSIAPDILRNLLLLKELPVQDYESITDIHIKTYLDALLGKSESSYSIESTQRDVIARFRVDSSEEHAAVRILKIFSDYLTLSCEPNWQFADTNPKLAITHLVSILKHHSLKDTVETDL
jgi:hypothetical protein